MNGMGQGSAANAILHNLGALPRVSSLTAGPARKQMGVPVRAPRVS
jgi:hypothetical protein